jgi:hypothetical protein
MSPISKIEELKQSTKELHNIIIILVVLGFSTA